MFSFCSASASCFSVLCLLQLVHHGGRWPWASGTSVAQAKGIAPEIDHIFEPAEGRHGDALAAAVHSTAHVQTGTIRRSDTAARALTEAPVEGSFLEAGDEVDPRIRPRPVKTAAQLRQAVSEGYQRILLQEHLSLPLADGAPDGDEADRDAWLPTVPAWSDNGRAVSIVGNCKTPPDLAALGVRHDTMRPLEPGQCLILTGVRLIGVHDTSLWLHNLYIRVTAGDRGNRSEPGLREPGAALRRDPLIMLNSGSRIWLTQTVLQGAERLHAFPDGIRGLTIAEEPFSDVALRVFGIQGCMPSLVFAQGVHFMDLGAKMLHGPERNNTPGVRQTYQAKAPVDVATSSEGTAAARFVDCTFTGVIVNGSYRGIVNAEGGASVWLQDCLFADNAAFRGRMLTSVDAAVFYNDGPEPYYCLLPGSEYLPYDVEREYVQVEPELAPPRTNAAQFLSLNDAFIVNSSKAFGISLPERTRAVPFTSAPPAWYTEVEVTAAAPRGARWAAIACAIAALASIAVYAG